MKLRISPDLTLPLDVVTESIAILARKGGGKSYTADVLAEEMHAAEVPFVILDPKGDHWGLRSSADGKRDGIPITILGGEHGDLPLAPEDGRIVADLVIEHPGWYLLDISQFPSRAGEIRFGTEFAERLWRAKAPRANHWPMHLFVDEADMFVPQNTRGELARSVGAYEVLGKQGRGRGLGVSFISQRSAVINKNVLTQTEILIVLQTTSPQDRKAVGEWFEGNATPEVTKAALSSLASLGRGEAQIYSPRLLGELVKVQIRERKTFDSGRTPRVGERIIVPARLAAVDVKAALERMAATVERAKAQDPAELQRRVRALTKDLETARRGASRPAEVLASPTDRALKAQLRQLSKAVEAAMKFIVQINLPEIDAQLGEKDRANLQRAITAAVEASTKMLDGKLAERQRSVDRLRREGQRVLEQLGKALDEDVAVEVKVKTQEPFAVENPEPVAPRRRSSVSTASSNGTVTNSQQRVLNALAWFASIGLDSPSRPGLAFIAGTRPTSGGFKNNLGSLRSAGLLDYPSEGRVKLTDDGAAHAVAPDFAFTAEALQEEVLARVTNSQAAILRALIAAYPTPLTREALADKVGVPITSGGFKNNLGALRTLELIDYPSPGAVVALPVLFLEGAA